jgi:hypothetical protein
MATSRSNEPVKEWVAGASLFSGRRDPTWPVTQDAAEHLLQVWRRLAKTSDALPTPPALGYRGAFLRSPRGEEWRAFGGVIEYQSQGRVERRRDQARAFERELLQSAPDGVIPSNPLDHSR